MSAIIRINVDDSEIQQGLQQLTSKLQNLSPVFKNIGEYMVFAIQERFDDEVDAAGKAWAPLSSVTIQRKQQRRKIQKILQQDGDLRRTIIYQATASGVEIGTNRVYGAIHQFGGRAGKGKKVLIPARPYLGVSEADRSEIVRIIEDYLD